MEEKKGGADPRPTGLPPCTLATQDPRDGTVKYAYWTAYVILGFLFACAIVNHLENYNTLNRQVLLPSPDPLSRPAQR